MPQCQWGGHNIYAASPDENALLQCMVPVSVQKGFDRLTNELGDHCQLALDHLHQLAHESTQQQHLDEFIGSWCDQALQLALEMPDSASLLLENIIYLLAMACIELERLQQPATVRVVDQLSMRLKQVMHESPAINFSQLTKPTKNLGNRTCQVVTDTFRAIGTYLWSWVRPKRFPEELSVAQFRDQLIASGIHKHTIGELSYSCNLFSKSHDEVVSLTRAWQNLKGAGFRDDYIHWLNNYLIYSDEPFTGIRALAEAKSEKDIYQLFQKYIQPCEYRGQMVIQALKQELPTQQITKLICDCKVTDYSPQDARIIARFWKYAERENIPGLTTLVLANFLQYEASAVQKLQLVGRLSRESLHFFVREHILSWEDPV
ncbi:hypothetical protein PAHA111176_16035 [Parendozoicomonas haliclonae]|uniref:Uncharacterized protein n=2 Tax=Parendozoicomonas haliclonae TaxID=1960125 RepID=A0A1X7AMR0_9GAMM|nr:hypothetical protein EHSB41UT_03337 [Parendozoicomonas haliclonae]